MEQSAAAVATEPARWLLDRASAEGGLPLTQTHAIARAVVREFAELWPGWWDAKLFGPPHREADLRMLELLHTGLKRLRLLRRRGRMLYATKRGRDLAADPVALLTALAGDLGGGKEFTEIVAGSIIDSLRGGLRRTSDDLAVEAAACALRDRWREQSGLPPTPDALGYDVAEVVARGEAYGLLCRGQPEDGSRWWLDRRIELTAAAAQILESSAATDRQTVPALLFEAELLNAPGVGATIAIGLDQRLAALHDALQTAFGWWNDHLYSFWIDGVFWSGKDREYTSPITEDHGAATADVPIGELDLSDGAQLAYVFDFGEEWRVMLTLTGRDQRPGRLPRVLERRSTAPEQYPHLGEPAF